MSAHYCRRCGHEATCSHGNWADRHPWAAVAAGIPLGIIGLMCLCVYPAVCLPALVLVALAHVISQRHKTTHALALRADYEHAALIVSQRPAPARVRRPAHPANLHTVPLRTQGV